MFAAKDTLLTRPSGYSIARSVRTRASASAYFNRTLSSSNRQTWTWSAWVKLGSSTGSDQFLFSTQTGGFGQDAYFRIQSDGTFDFKFDYNGSSVWRITTTQVFRDPSAWYHIVVVADTTNATSSSRLRLYVNGSQVTAFGTASYPSQNANGTINLANAHYFSVYTVNGAYFDGYLTEINFVDGQALTPSSFGETNAITGVWQPKSYSGTYGTNGFELNFSDNSAATAATIGKDYSGNGNNWTPNNINVTAYSGTPPNNVSYDSMVDSPTVGATSSNYAVMNPNDQAGGLVVADGNLKVTAATGWDGSRATFAYPSTGKYYWEATCISRATGAAVGILGTSAVIAGDLGSAATGYIYNSGDGNKYNNGSGSAYGATWGTNDIIGIAWDADTGTLSFYKNGTSQGTAYSSLTGQFSPAIGVNGSDSMAANFGQRPFSNTPPTGFVALNTQNLPAPTISNGANYMAATTYTGTGATQTISNSVSGISFQPDWVWVKSRSAATDHGIYDSVRGVQKQIESNSSGAETTETTGLTAFGSTGFTVGALAQMNTSAATYVAWQWKAGTSSSITVSQYSSGVPSIASTVNANTTAGFSIVQFTATGATATVGHGLGVAPQMIIVKDAASAGNWAVWHTSLASTAYYLFMNTTAAQANTSAIWTGTPSSTTFGIGSWHTADRQIAYCFAAVAGYSAFGSYTGNGSADGPFVFTGFRPRFVMIKSAGTANGWAIIDTARNTINVSGTILEPNSSNAEATYTQWQIDILSNGFKVRSGAYNESNGNGTTYIYAAFAENPFKLSLAR